MAVQLASIFFTMILVDNYVLVKFLGICPFLGVSKKLDSAVGMSLAVTFVMVLATAATWPIQMFLLTPPGSEGTARDLGYLQTIVFILIIAILVQLLENILKKFIPTLYKSLGVYLPLITTNCTILGIDLSFPVMAAPIGGVSFNMSDAMSEDDYIFAILEGSRAAGVIGCTGDGVPPFIIDAAVKALKACNGHGIPFIKPWEGKELFEKIDRVLADGSPILGVDVDAAGLITLRKMGRPVMPMSVTELETVVRYVHDMGRKFIVKGIMTPDDAHRAIDAGCDAIVVSNHGGRVLDHCPGTATVLPAIADAVRGKITILADGAVRDGVDVLKMLALGADAVLVGRPLCIAAIGGGVEGVTKYWQQMQGQLVQAMLLTGCASLADVREHIIYRG